MVVLDPAANDKADILRVHRSREKQYAFDFVFDTPSTQVLQIPTPNKLLIHDRNMAVGECVHEYYEVLDIWST